MIKGYDTRMNNADTDFRRIPFNVTQRTNERFDGFSVRDCDAENAINRMTNLSKGLEYKIYNFIINLKKDLQILNLTDAFDALYLMCLDTQVNSFINLAQNQYDITTGGAGTTFTAFQGFRGNGTSSYLSTNFTPSTSTNANFTRNDAIGGVYVSQRGTVTSFDLLFGVQTASPNAIFYLYNRNFQSTYRFGANTTLANELTSSAVTPLVGLCAVSRTNSTTSQLTINGGVFFGQNAAVASAALPSAPITICGAPSPLSSFGNDLITFAFIGAASRIDVKLLNKRVVEFMQSLALNA